VGLISVITDSREPTWVQQLTFGGVPVAVSQLETGDLLAVCGDGALLAIERKEASDFLNSLRDGRLFPQLARLRQVSEWSYLALVGSLLPGPNGLCLVDGRESGWNWSSVAGALLTVQELGISVLHVAHDVDYEQAIMRLANRDRSELRIAPPRDAALVSDAEVILGSLPGVGPERAHTLVQYAGSVASAIQYLTDDLLTEEQIPGIGPGIKRRVRKALGLEDWDILAICQKDPTQTVPQRVQEKIA
jgi:DNA excision repair protein ERCC-4